MYSVQWEKGLWNFDNAKDGARLKLEKVAGSDIWYILLTEEKSSLFRVGEKSI